MSTRAPLLATLALLALSGSPAAVQADLQSVRCGPDGSAQLTGSPTGKKGKTFLCRASGPWLDITDSVSGGSGLAVSIFAKGTSPGPHCTVRIQVSSSASVGDKKITLSRPAFGGRDHDEFFFKVTAE